MKLTKQQLKQIITLSEGKTNSVFTKADRINRALNDILED